MPTEANSALPTLPALAAIPLRMTPGVFKTTVITRALNTLFAAPLAEGELEFLAGRWMNVAISDAGLAFSVTLRGARLAAAKPAAAPNLSIEGSTYAFLKLASREEDADTLFFRRQLRTQGDTELGLYLKNFLDGLEPESLPYHKILDPLLRNSLRLADRIDKIRAYPQTFLSL